MVRRHNFFLPSLSRGLVLPLEQSIIAWLHAFRASINIPRCVAAFLIPICLSMGPITAMGAALARTDIRCAFAVAYYTATICNRKIREPIGVNNYGTSGSNSAWSFPHHALDLFRTFLPNSATTYIVTGSSPNGLKERSAARRPLLERMTGPLMLWQMFWFLATATIFVTHIISLLWRSHDLGSKANIYVYTALLLRLFTFTEAALGPIKYMIWPPTDPDRKSLLKEDDHGVLRPRDKGLPIAKNGAWFGWRDGLAAVIIILCDWL